MRTKLISFLLFTNLAVGQQTVHISTIVGTPNGNALNIDGPASGNGDIVLVPGNVSGNASVLIQNGRTDQPSLIISQQNAGNITEDVLNILDASGNVVFGIGGAGVAAGFPGPNSIGLHGNLVPNADNTYYNSLANFAWKYEYAHTEYVENVQYCASGEAFNTSYCYTMNAGSGDWALYPPTIYTPLYPGSPIMGITPYNGSGGPNAQKLMMAGEIAPVATNTFNLGDSTYTWATIYAEELYNTTATTSIDGVAYSCPSANASGCLTNDGSGSLSWASCGSGGSGVSSLNTHTGALTLAGTTNEITITYSGGTFTFATPQAICTGCNVQFLEVTTSEIVGESGTTTMFGNFIPTSNDAYNLGSSSDTWANGYINELEVSDIAPLSGSTIDVIGDLIPLSNLTYSIGTSSVAWLAGYFGVLAVSGSSTLGAITLGSGTTTSVLLTDDGEATFYGGAVGIGSTGVAIGSGMSYQANGASGQSVTLNASASSCSITVTGGVITGHSGC